MNICFEKFFFGTNIEKKIEQIFWEKFGKNSQFFFSGKIAQLRYFLGFWRCVQWIGNGHFAIFPRQTSRRTRFSLHESFGQILHHCPSRCASTGQNDWTWTQQVFRIIGQNRRIRSKPQYKIGTSAIFLIFFSLLIPYF